MVEPKMKIINDEDYAVREHRSLWLDAWRRLTANRTAMIGLIVVALFILSATFAHFFWEYNPKSDLDYGAKLLPPQLVVSEEVPDIHIFGTDKLGRDIFRRVVHGGWNSLRVGLVAVGISLIAGSILGLLAGFFEGINMNFYESLALMTLLGLGLGALPAWIAKQTFQIFLFAFLGAGSVLLNRFENNISHYWDTHGGHSRTIHRPTSGLGMRCPGFGDRVFISSSSSRGGIFQYRHAVHGCHFVLP